MGFIWLSIIINQGFESKVDRLDSRKFRSRTIPHLSQFLYFIKWFQFLPATADFVETVIVVVFVVVGVVVVVVALLVVVDDVAKNFV